ncbi:TIGR03943 family putative permease subunit [Streptomyces sp. STR69]|uniref:TIGR03943 family putative permease subunit n=1 Tax=Streptomyces sp. STR69 TaxID=1796942 RepID=UPI0021C82E4B|nr:TIGR03943 family protein [Streptomyces sp. STR69]
MKRTAQIPLLILTGLGLLHTALFTDLYLRYVKEGLRPLLIISGALLLLLGLAHAAFDHDTGEKEDHAHGHDHSTAPRIAWLLFLPALSLLLYAPPALGAYTAAHAGSETVKQQKGFAALAATSPLPMTLTAFTTRVQQDKQRAINGRTVELTGFVTPGHGGWDLTRIIFTCCAADAQTVKIRMYGTPAPPANTWLAVTGTWHTQGALGTKSAVAALDVHGTRPIAQPVNAFTDDLPLTPTR